MAIILGWQKIEGLKGLKKIWEQISQKSCAEYKFE